MHSAVLFLIFNRPEPTARVFDAIRQAMPPRLYIAADGPRADRDGEVGLVGEVRKIVTNVDWPCEVKTLFRERNLGCKYAVSSAVDWFFDNEEEGIVLEDDCLPAQSFFRFCEGLLERYRDDNRIWQISGTTHFSDKISLVNADYCFSRYGPIWGWASWRRAWKHYDVELSNWAEMKRPELMSSVYPHALERESKRRIGNRLAANDFDTWDYQWAIIKAYNKALTILPCHNQIVNIGFGPDATHTVGINTPAPRVSKEMSSLLKHPKFVVADRGYDENYANQMFRKLSIWARVKARLRKLLSLRKARLK